MYFNKSFLYCVFSFCPKIISLPLKLKSKGIDLDRKVLADLAMNEPETFTELANSLKS